jgi:nucleotide-binding universal stress UspA family protein
MLEPNPILSEGIAERELERLVQQHLTSRASCRIMTRRGDPAAVIVTVAEELNVDLIVMPTHGHKGIERMILGSVAERVAREAERPVLTLRLSSGASGSAAA